MMVKDCYEALGGNYEDVVACFFDDYLVKKFARMFIHDTSYHNLCTSLAADKVEDAFRAAHTMKGICANLYFTRLFESVAQITEALRAKDLETAKTMMPTVSADYQVTIEALKKL